MTWSATSKPPRPPGWLVNKLGTYLRPSVLVADEVGYRPLERAEANPAFQVISKRDEKGPITLTSNNAFSEWGQAFGEKVFATAILDRPCTTAKRSRSTACAHPSGVANMSHSPGSCAKPPTAAFAVAWLALMRKAPIDLFAEPAFQVATHACLWARNGSAGAAAPLEALPIAIPIAHTVSKLSPRATVFSAVGSDCQRPEFLGCSGGSAGMGGIPEGILESM